MQCHSVLGVRAEEIAQLANIRDLMESSKHVSSPCRLSQVCTLLPSVCLIGSPLPPVQSLVFLVTAASPILHPSNHSWSPHTEGHNLFSVELAHSLLPLPPYFSLRLTCLLLDFCFLTFPGNCIIPNPLYFLNLQSILIASYPGFCFSSNGLGLSLWCAGIVTLRSPCCHQAREGHDNSLGH